MSDARRAQTYAGVPAHEALAGAPPVMERLAAHARTHPDDPGLTAIAADGCAREYTYGELEARSRALACELGAGPGDVLALAPRNDAPSVITVFAALRAGCALLVLSPNDPPARRRVQADALGARELPILYEPEAAAGDAGPPAVSPSAVAFYFGTSGSTAVSKLVAQSHANVIANAEALRRHHGLRRGDRILGCLPIHHVNGAHFTLLASVASGAHAILAETFDPLSYPGLLTRFRPRIASVVPSILQALVDIWRGPPPPRELEYLVSAAAPLSTETVRAAVERLGRRVLQGYGLTETTNFSATMPRNLCDAAYRRLALDGEIPSIGIALHGNDMAVLRPDGAPAADGEVGELCMRGHNVMEGYAANPEATAQAFRGGWFHSEDLGLALRDPDGRRFFVVTGRIKNIAKVRGESVSLDELERTLRTAPGVRDAACAVVPKHYLGEAIVAGVVLCDSKVDLAAWLEPRVSAVAIPDRFVAMEQIPRTPTGKIRRAELAERLA